METDDTSTGGEGLSISQAAAAFVKATSTPEVVTDDHAETEEETQSDDTTDDELQASDEDVSEETDGETEDEEHTAEGEADESESEQGRFVADNGRVRLADGSITTIHELKRGFLRESDYTRKTQETSALQTETAAERERIKASEQQLEQQREYVVSLVKSILPPQPDPDKANPRSEKYDPAGYQAEQVAFEQWSAHLQHLETEQQRAQEGKQAETAKQTEERLTKEWTTALEKMPELKDPKRLEAFGQKSLKYGSEYGYTPQELATIHHDHRQLLVLKDAIKWRELQASKGKVEKKVEGRPSVLKGGKRLNPSEHRARSATDAMTRLKSSGSVDDATAAYIASLNKG